MDVNKVSSTNFDVLIEELSFENFREGDDDLRILNVGDLRFDIFPDNVVQLLGEDQLHLGYHFSPYAQSLSFAAGFRTVCVNA